MNKEIFQEKSIRELVELVHEGTVPEIVIENEIEKTQYIIDKSRSVSGVSITVYPIKEAAKAPKYAEWEGNPDEFLDKALDYMKEPFPKVTKEVLDSYKMFLEAEQKRLIALSEAYLIRFHGSKKILDTLRKSRKANEERKQEIKVGRLNLERQRILEKAETIKQFLAHEE